MGDLWIRGGTVVTATGTTPADVIIRQGRIAAVVAREPGAGSGWDPGAGLRSDMGAVPGTDGLPVLDVTGKWVLPGLIDVHVHLRDPGLTHKEDFATGTLAAALGGVTTVLDMPNTVPPVATGALLKAKAARAVGRAYVDYGLYGLIDEHNGDELAGLAEAGAIGFKLFLGPTTGDLRAPGWGRLLDVFAMVGELGLPLVVHAEDRDVIEYATAKAGSEPVDYGGFLATRPRFGEVAATQRICLLAQMTGTPVHIAHVTLAEAVDVLRQAKAAGAPVTAETCPPYLTMTAEDCEALGPVSKVLPPIRSAEDKEALWRGLHEGVLDLIATDHAPHEAEAKEGGWLAAAGGMAGVQTMLPVLLNEVHRGRLTLAQLVQWTSAGPAARFGLHRKGDVQPGFDGDVVVVDRHQRTRVEAGSVGADGEGPAVQGAPASAGVDGPRPVRWRSKSANSGLLGVTLTGRVIHTVVGGRVVVRDGEPTGERPGIWLRGGRLR